VGQAQLEQRQIPYEAPDNGSLSCADPRKLQEIRDSLGWLGRTPLPLRSQDRENGYDWNLSMWQVEVSLPQIFDRPSTGA